MAKLTKAARYLIERDPAMARIITSGRPFQTSSEGDLYLDLLESIMSQQLSVSAAATIFRRFLDLFPGRYPQPRALARMTPARLRTAGVSRQKAGYLRNVAVFALKGGLDSKTLGAKTDDEVVEHLSQIKGVGRWTAEMLLMFSLGRPDIFPADDLGIQIAMKRLYGLRGSGRTLHKRMAKIADQWRPHRTLACKWLWRWRRTI